MWMWSALCGDKSGQKIFSSVYGWDERVKGKCLFMTDYTCGIWLIGENYAVKHTEVKAKENFGVALLRSCHLNSII